MNLPETCPFCGAGVRHLEYGKEDRDGGYVKFECHTYIQLHIKDPCNRSPTCKNITRVVELEAHIKTITEGCARENLNIEQICGKALGYPRYCDDQKNFPGATEEDGVCVGEHVAASIASELANKYQDLLARCKRLEEALGLVLKMRDDWLESQDDGYAGAYYAFVKGNDSKWDVITKAKEAKP